VLIENWEIIAIIGASSAAFITVGLNAYELRKNAKVTRQEFWLKLSEMFAKHDEIHQKLRPPGNLSAPQDDCNWIVNEQLNLNHEQDEDWPKVESYLGLFEHCYHLLKSQIIDLETFKSIYGYRLKNILANKQIIKQKLVFARNAFKDFLLLLKKVKLEKCDNDACYHYREDHEKDGKCNCWNGTCPCQKFQNMLKNIEDDYGSHA